jgi:hypothetical protein
MAKTISVRAAAGAHYAGLSTANLIRLEDGRPAMRKLSRCKLIEAISQLAAHFCGTLFAQKYLAGAQTKKYVNRSWRGPASWQQSAIR